MTRDEFDIKDATPAGQPHPAPSFQDVLAHRRRPRRLRVSTITAAVVMALFGVVSLTHFLKQGQPEPLALPTTTAWLAEPPGSQWLRSTPKFTLDDNWINHGSLQ